MNSDSIARHAKAVKGLKIARYAVHNIHPQTDGLASLQKSTASLMNSGSRKWGFADSSLTVKRQKINNDLWKLTVENPKTHEKILEVEGSGDELFANEDNFARMAEAITHQGLKITTNFD